MTPVALAIFGYLVLQFGIGVWASRRIATEDDYLVAGRRLGYPLGIFSIFATWFGAETCIGAAGDIAENGISWTTAEPFGYGLCIIIMGLVFAVPLWNRRLTTFADLFRQRYSVGVERMAALFLIPTSVLWAAAQIRAFGHVLSSVTTMNVGPAIAVAAAVVILYTSVGGMLADAITDLVQGVALTIGLAITFVAVIVHLGGPVDALALVANAPHVAREPATWLEALEAWSVPVLGSVVATELVSRVIAARSGEVARNSSVIAGFLYIAVGLMPAFIGLVGYAVVPALTESEQMLAAVAETLLPTVLYAVFAGALISAILSTVDSTLLIASGLLSHNLVVHTFPRLGERDKVRFARGGVIAFGLLAYVIAMHSSSVMDLIETSSAFGSSGILVIVCFGLFSRFGGAAAAIAALAVGMVTYVAGTLAGAAVPFVASLLASLVAYVAVAAAERVRVQPALDGT